MSTRRYRLLMVIGALTGVCALSGGYYVNGSRFVGELSVGGQHITILPCATAGPASVG